MNAYGRSRTARFGIGTVLVLFITMFSGCLREVDQYYSYEPDVQYVNPGVFPGEYNGADRNGSELLQRGFLPHGDPEVFRIHSKRSHLGVAGEGPVTVGTVFITMAVWRPMDGTTDQVPIIVDAGPYFESGYYCPTYDNPCSAPLAPLTIQVPSQTTPFLLKNFLPHGYAIAQVAVRGTGTSGGCMDLMGPDEQADLDQAITWLAEQDWSNGNVAMIGASYDGSTPWLVAAKGNPSLKTIVPVASLPDIFDLMFHNGSAESRGPIMHDVVYWPYGFSNRFPHPAFPIGIANGREDYQDRQNLLCPEVYEGAVMGGYATVMGERGAEFSTYWKERDYRDDVLANYKGSVFINHGLQDWNVDPHAVVPFTKTLREAGIEVKEWYGQWGHAFPDSTCPKSVPNWIVYPCRLDYAEVLHRWFNFYLKDNVTAVHGPGLQIQDDRGFWHLLEDYPPTNSTWLTFHATSDGRLDANESSTKTSRILAPPLADPDTLQPGPAHYLEFKTEPFANDTRLTGQPQFHVEFEAMGPGGYLGAWLFDENAEGKVLDRWRWIDPPGPEPPAPRALSEFGAPPIVGHAQLDLRFHAGGEEQSPLVPGQRYPAKIEFDPLDLYVPAGHRLTVWLFQFQYSDHLGSPVPSPVKVFMGGPDGTVFRIMEVPNNPFVTFPVPGAHFPLPADFERLHVRKPRFNEVIAPINGANAEAANCLELLRAQLLREGALGSIATGVPTACGR